MNVDIHLINRFNVGCQSISRAIAITVLLMINTDLAWKSLILAHFSAEPRRGERPPFPPRKSRGSYYWLPLSQAVQRLPANSLACSVTRRTPDTKICRGRRFKRVSKLLCLNVQNTYFSESLISLWLNCCLTTPYELTNFHILEFNLKQFEVFGIEHL